MDRSEIYVPPVVTRDDQGSRLLMKMTERKTGEQAFPVLYGEGKKQERGVKKIKISDRQKKRKDRC